MDRIGRAAAVLAVALTVGMSGAGAARAEFWVTEYFLTQPKDAQRAYVTGLLDMYQQARRQLAPDPGDKVLACANRETPEVLRAMFVEWALDQPAAWRLPPADLFLQALRQFCKVE